VTETVLVFEFEALDDKDTDAVEVFDFCADNESFAEGVLVDVMVIVPFDVNVGGGLRDCVVVCEVVRVILNPVCDDVPLALGVFDSVDVCVAVALFVCVMLLRSEPVIVSVIFGVFDAINELDIVGDDVLVFETRKLDVRHAVLLAVLLCVVDDVVVFVCVVVVVAVPDPVWVFDTGIVRVCDVDPVDVFEAAGLLVDVMVVLIVFVRLDDMLNDGEDVDVFDTGAERVPDGEAVGVFVAGEERVYEGVALCVFD
jgi:hypothetical protein